MELVASVHTFVCIFYPVLCHTDADNSVLVVEWCLEKWPSYQNGYPAMTSNCIYRVITIDIIEQSHCGHEVIAPPLPQKLLLGLTRY